LAPFLCPNCDRLLHFEARVCPNCTATLGYYPPVNAFLFLADQLTVWRDHEGDAHEVVVCANNNEHEVCNWLVATDDTTPLCRACRHNRTIPDLTGPNVPERWGRIEAAKRRLFHSLLRLNLPLENRVEDPQGGLAFDFLYDPAAEAAQNPTILTGHDGGLITLNIIEADDVARERLRRELGEPYRTLLGHFRHEVGHWYWSRLVEDKPALEEFRALFGDESIDYGEALKAHYANGAGASSAWTDDYVSAYACSHPWEDFAETFAHFLHMTDTLATICGLGMKMNPFPDTDFAPAVGFNPYAATTDALVTQWVPFSFAFNAINRAMGQPDLYPFHLSAGIVKKLDYVNRLLAEAGGRTLT
jgi:hypothetical protein